MDLLEIRPNLVVNAARLASYRIEMDGGGLPIVTLSIGDQVLPLSPEESSAWLAYVGAEHPPRKLVPEPVRVAGGDLIEEPDGKT